MTKAHSEKLRQLLVQHPAPWRYVPHMGEVYMLNALGTQVPLFDMLDYCQAMTYLSTPAAQATQAS
ncbi:hypothetical protein [Comamonas thiooxydans]|uniref:hypothetical protein n=1 Tax=Comamonas thiooxydans TaxID=363952 RepID=UPI0007C5316A|nr:hypothetical protein [Comamonas thiooxydans]